MSVLTVQTDQFIVNKLQSKIDDLNLSLVSMEEYGFMSSAITDTRNKLNKITSIYTFLKEYTYGNEETDSVLIRDLINLAGGYNTSRKAIDGIIQSTVDSNDISIVSGNYNIVRIYKDGEILLSNTITSTSLNTVFNIFVGDAITKLVVTFEKTGTEQKVFTGVRNITIPDVVFDDTDILSFSILAYRGSTLVLDTSRVYDIQTANCAALTYLIGNTQERFKINNILNESSDISRTPNDPLGNPSGTQLTYAWLTDPINNMTEYVFRESVTRLITVYTGDTHALILLPKNLQISNVKEVVVDLDGTILNDNAAVGMTQGLHYEIFNINSFSSKYNCVYIRDLTSTVFPSRTFQFDISII